jgi:hypothetical protein
MPRFRVRKSMARNSYPNSRRPIAILTGPLVEGAKATAEPTRARAMTDFILSVIFETGMGRKRKKPVRRIPLKKIAAFLFILSPHGIIWV